MGAKLEYTSQSFSLEGLKLEPIKAPDSPSLAGSKEPFTDKNETSPPMGRIWSIFRNNPISELERESPGDI